MNYIVSTFVLLFIVTICLNFYLYKTATNSYNRHCISLIIPSTFYAWNKCNNQIEKMICSSIEMPKEIIVVISGSKLNKTIIHSTYCKRKIYVFYRKENKNSASNKNYGYKFSKCNYISFFDSDDVMSPYRITVLKYILLHFSEYDIIMHMYTKNYSQLSLTINTIDIQNYFYLNSSYISYLYRNNIKTHKIQLWGCCHFLPIQYHISNGWITVKRSMFVIERFNEDVSVQRAEDSEYNGRVISKGYKALILTLILGYYSKQNECS